MAYNLSDTSVNIDAAYQHPVNRLGDMKRINATNNTDTVKLNKPVLKKYLTKPFL